MTRGPKSPNKEGILKSNNEAEKPKTEEKSDLIKKLAIHEVKRSRMSMSAEQGDIPSATEMEASMQGGPTGDDELPDWFEDLNADNENAFKELFDMLDYSKTGSLTTDTLYEGLKRVDSGISRDEVEAVMNKLDKDGNGEIDFEEFLIHMTTGDLLGGSTQDGSKRGFSRRQRLIFTALTQFNLKKKLELEKKRQPHVIGHYTAGVRIDGLTDRQLTRLLKNLQKKLQKTAKKHDSPYARPLPFVSLGICKKDDKNSKYKLSTKRVDIGVKETNSKRSVTPPPSPNAAWKTQWKIFATKVHTDVNVTESTQLLDSIRKGLPPKLSMKIFAKKPVASTDIILNSPSPPPPETEKHKRSKSVAIGKGVVPQIGKCRTPLPLLKIHCKLNKPTIDDLPQLRTMANTAVNDYYQKLRKASVKNSYEHWDKLYADTIRPKKLLENFRKVYRAYSPHEEAEAFVVCPWMRGPDSYFKRKVDSHIRPFSGT